MSGNYRFSPTRPGWKLFRQPRPGRRLSEQNDAVIERRLLDAGVIRGASGPPVLLWLSEEDGALICTQRGAKGALD